MSTYNKVIMLGNLTRAPELKTLPSGQNVCRMTLATNRQMKGKPGSEPMQEVCFIDVDVWGAQAESCKKFLDKGSSVLLEGRLKLESWQDTEGQKRSRHTIVADRVTFVRTNYATADTAGEDSLDSGSVDLDSLMSSGGITKGMPSGDKKAKRPRSKSASGMGEVADDDGAEDLLF